MLETSFFFLSNHKTSFIMHEMFVDGSLPKEELKGPFVDTAEKRSEWSMALFTNPGVRVRSPPVESHLPLFSAAAAKRRARWRSERRAKRAFRESPRVWKARFGSTNQRGRREAASAWRVKAERSEAFTRQQGLQAVVTAATFLGQRVQEG